ncbi:hypothetical protein KUL42_31120 [Alteromonas sp. KUL42]|uniref:methyltransferase n=1 Tax=Alteromonas sp. KUL42 TaxID=2480797 RepID=UPI0010355E39|nr:methyltransferase [Alteromonas sp. KUL42]TAP33486.1 methyltransferase domain-containing protein [Alteromonas sp. KUL42]GEA08351.1 hypothetical protein KUL42_31120 [Alteromonas sp. KUL42]
MKNWLRWLLSFTLKPFLQHYYLKSARQYRYKHLKLKVEPGVFHPGLFFSSKFMASFIHRLELANSRMLDMGCGSGMLSFVAAQKGAEVVSVDLSDAALANTLSNALANNIDVTVLKSDLFDQVDGHFDLIVVNPPYYPRNPKNEQQLAWYCGEQFQYFQRFFAALSHHTKESSQVFMVLSEGCDLQSIKAIAAEYQFTMHCICEKNLWLERNYIFAIQRNQTNN